jgi:hypothetical protein
VNGVLAIMGSGETSPTMVTTHKGLLARSGPPAVLLDTPFGFQANADELTAKAVEYFRTSVGVDMGVASFRSAEVDPMVRETALARLREASYAFAGPGSPSYALRQWAGTPVPDLLAGVLERGGTVCFASAAALTLGVVTVPVYEIYKVGETPRWLEGLDLLGRATGLCAAVVPHFDNAEGGTHDTRFCYLGEDRLRRLEADLPDGAFVLGVDEHTGLVLDLAAGSASVVGRGGVTIRRDGRSLVLPAGTTVPLADLGSAGEGGVAAVAAPAAAPVDPASLGDALAALESRFDDALGGREPDAAVAAALDLEAAIVGWSADSLQSDQADRARAALRSMVVRLGARAADPAGVVAPFVDALLDVRARARAAGDFSGADAVRDRLLAAGVEVNDSREGTGWRLLS